jgi:hypothetical protein
MRVRGRSPRSPSHPSAFLPLLLVAALAACSDASGPGDVRAPLASLTLSANVVGTPIDVLVVTVTSADIPTPLVFNLTAVEGVAQGTIRVPPGPARFISVEAFDAEGNITHEGEATVDVRAGMNSPIHIPLRPRAGQVPITVTISSLIVQIIGGTGAMLVGTTYPFEAWIFTPEGFWVEGTVQWASTNPAILSIATDGTATAVSPGVANVVATFDGYAAMMQVTVADPGLAGYYEGQTIVGASGNLVTELGLESMLLNALFGCSPECYTFGELHGLAGGDDYTFNFWVGTQLATGDVTRNGYMLVLPSIEYQAEITLTAPTTVTCTSQETPIAIDFFHPDGVRLYSAPFGNIIFACSATDPLLGTLTGTVAFDLSLQRVFSY